MKITGSLFRNISEGSWKRIAKTTAAAAAVAAGFYALQKLGPNPLGIQDAFESVKTVYSALDSRGIQVVAAFGLGVLAKTLFDLRNAPINGQNG